VDVQVVGALFSDGVTHQHVEGLSGVEQVLADHVQHSDLQVAVHLNVHGHDIVEAGLQLVVLLLIILGEEVSEEPRAQVAAYEGEHVLDHCGVLRFVASHQLFVASRDDVVLELALGEVFRLLPELVQAVVVSWPEVRKSPENFDNFLVVDLGLSLRYQNVEAVEAAVVELVRGLRAELKGRLLQDGQGLVKVVLVDLVWRYEVHLLLLNDLFMLVGRATLRPLHDVLVDVCPE